MGGMLKPIFYQTKAKLPILPKILTNSVLYFSAALCYSYKKLALYRREISLICCKLGDTIYFLDY